MADAAGPVEPARRPVVVTIACWLLYVVAACQVLYAIVVLSQLGAAKAAFATAFRGSELEGAEDMMVAITAATTVGRSLLFAIGYTALAILDGRGKNPARIVTWVAAGLSICCSGSDLLSNAIAATSLGGGAGKGPTNRQIQQALAEALPGWYQPTLTTINLLSVTAAVTAVVLLALPIANTFFRKPQQVAWGAPVPQMPPPTA